MRTQIEFSEIIGKTIERFAIDDDCGHIFLSFTDGTFSAIKLRACGENVDIEEINPKEFDLLDAAQSAIVAADIASNVVINQLRQERVAKYKAEHQAKLDERDRKEFERLRKKFGSDLG